MTFETIGGALSKFDNIKYLLNSSKSQEKYIQNWVERYSNIIKIYNIEDMIDWEIRHWRAIKEIYASAILFKEAEYAIKNRCMASYYFSLYYSLFHAMLSALCYDTQITRTQIIDINHSKVGNVFKSTYCSGKNSIISPSIFDAFITFKYKREYFSYTPPLNLDMYDEEDLKTADMYLTQCFQLTNLQSCLLEIAYHKHGHIHKFENENEFYYFINSFVETIAKKDNLKNEQNIDPADENVRNEILRDGIGGIVCIAASLDHTFDEFRLYNGASEFYRGDDGNSIGSNSIYSIIYQKIIS